MNKEFDKRPTRARVRVSSRSLPEGPYVELLLELAEQSNREGDPPALDRHAALAALDRVDALRPVGRDDDEWLDPEGRIRVIVGEARLIFRLQLTEESAEQLAKRLDHLFDMAFETAQELRLDVVDPLLGVIQTRFRYESQFPRILDRYYAKAKTELALQNHGAWEEFTKEGDRIPMPSEAPAFEADPDGLPTTIWTRRARKVGPLALTGERALAAMAGITPSSPWLAIARPGSRSGEDVALLRVLRTSSPVAGTVVIEAISAGLTRSLSVERAEGLRVRFRA